MLGVARQGEPDGDLVKSPRAVCCLLWLLFALDSLVHILPGFSLECPTYWRASGRVRFSEFLK